MQEDTRRAAKEGLAYGVVAGVLFGTMEIAGAAVMGDPPLMPLRMFASVVLGSEALETTAVGWVVSVGIAAHLGLSAMFGLVYGIINGGLSLETQTRWSRQAALGRLPLALMYARAERHIHHIGAHATA